ncbi:sigma-70 family RNA polymerase sigma factor [Kiritimatiellota bacterium B12222]|nr:sigma-70 family RNA polymerase sigma factor [Kiritimatiellota bacterium B12222]
MESNRELDPTRWLADHGDVLFRFALGRVRDPQTAEDLVQDTFLAAMKGSESFSGRSKERTWLIGILKHKIIDHFRKHKRMFLSEDLELKEQDPQEFLDRKGNWTVGQSAWITQPEKAYELKEFWKHLNACLEHLPQQQRQVYILRELEELSADDICESLEMSPSNLWVTLHRARLQLKDCLTSKGLGTQNRE